MLIPGDGSAEKRSDLYVVIDEDGRYAIHIEPLDTVRVIGGPFSYWQAIRYLQKLIFNG